MSPVSKEPIVALKVFDTLQAQIREHEGREQVMTLGLAVPTVGYFAVLTKELIVAQGGADATAGAVGGGPIPHSFGDMRVLLLELWSTFGALPQAKAFALIAFGTYPLLLILYYVQRMKLDAVKATLMLQQHRLLQSISRHHDAEHVLAFFGSRAYEETTKRLPKWQAVPSVIESAFGLGLTLAAGYFAALQFPTRSHTRLVTLVCFCMYLLGFIVLWTLSSAQWVRFGRAIGKPLHPAPKIAEGTKDEHKVSTP